MDNDDPAGFLLLLFIVVVFVVGVALRCNNMNDETNDEEYLL